VGGDAPYKRWREASFAALGDLLVRRLAVQVLVTGGTEDRSFAARVLSAMEEQAVDLSGKLGLLELAALFETCNVMVTNDTGPMHLAAAMGLPVVALFGPGRPGRYGPYGSEGTHSVIRHPVVCSPCTEFECIDRDCLRMIEPQEVLGRVEEHLSRKVEVCL
jgi:ADP-heptose:LPS heptosyltransferase